MKTVLDVHNLTVAYSGAPVLWSVDLEIKAGSFVGVVGPNGAGKSTLIKACLGLLPIQSGDVRFFDRLRFDEVRFQVAYLPQRESVDWDFPISVLEVVLMGTYPRVGLFKRPSKQDREFARQCLNRVGLEAFQSRQISELSGGQQQRVFLARALAQRADLYFLDEPFAAVDVASEETILKVLQDLKEEGKTIVVVHHDLYSISQNVDEAVLLNTRLIKHGSVQKVLTRENLKKAYGGQLESFSRVLHEIEKLNQ